jgi:signal transduction histidine kinase
MSSSALQRARASPGALLRAAAAALACALVLPIALAQAPAQVQVLERAEFLLSDARRPPPDASAWQPVALPDNWYQSRPDSRGVGWYRLAFDLPDDPGGYVIHVPRNSARGIIFFVNGRRVGANAGYGDPGTRNWAPPLVFSLSPELRKPGPNVLHVRVEALPELRQGLTRVLVGPGRLTRMYYEHRLALQVTTLFMFGAAALLCGLLALAFWARERADATLFWFAVTALAWAAAASPWVSGAVAPPQFWQGPLAFVARFAYAVPMLVLCLRAAGKRWPGPEAALWLFTLAGAALVWLVGEDWQGLLITYWSAAYLIALLVLLIVLIRSHRPQRGWSSRVLAASLVFAVLLNGHDFSWWMGWIDYDSIKLAHFDIPLVLFAIGATIIDRHFRAVAGVERAKVELEARVADKAREIEANYARVREAEREQALARERRRIMADMHDGLGSSLVGLLGAVQSGRATLHEVERRLHESLQELRLAVDALEPVDGDLGVVLGNVRHRMRSAIEDSSVSLNWRVGQIPQLSYLTPKAILAVQRIVLETLTNALRHARARELTVSTRVNGSWLDIRIADDGIGFDENAVSRGRGLDSVRQRALGLSGSVEIHSAPDTGTSVILRLPLQSPSAS